MHLLTLVLVKDLECEDLGWRKSESNEHIWNEWEQEVRHLLESYSNHLAIVMDCHN